MALPAVNRARGLGATWDDFDPGYPISSYPATPPFREEVDDGPSWWDTWGGPVLLGAEKALSNIFAPAATSVAQAQAPAYYPQQYSQNSRGMVAPQSVGFGIDGNGIRLSDGSHIGWVPIALAGLGIMLIQSRPFSRR